MFLIGCLILSLSTIGKNNPANSNPAVNPQADSVKERLRSFLEADWKYWMSEYPEAATAFGYPGRYNRWTDCSPAAIVRRNQHLEESLKVLRAIPRSELPGG
jgi:hypothetical protein